MRRKVTAKKIFSVVRLSLIPVWGWPIRNATKFDMFCVKLQHCFSIIMTIGLVLPLVYGITDNFNNISDLVTQIVVLGGLIHSISNFIFHMINYQILQKLTFEMVDFCDLMESHEEVIIQRYIDKCVLFHSLSMSIFYFMPMFTALLVPSLTDQPFPILTKCPFDTLQQPLRTIIYLQQTIVGLFVTGALCMNIYMALLIWYATARFEILAEELRKAINIYELYECIKKHQKLIEYANEITVVARPIAFSTVCCCMIGVIISFCLVVTHQPIGIIFQFTTASMTGISEVFMYTWPAEYLIHMCKEVGEAAFYLLENNDLLQIWKCLQIIIIRSQKPITISIPCFMPTLSLNYFASFISTILSYFTTLRIMMLEAD
ncbi:uncharacterized protein LOC120357663 isoform X2 [Solenopsis invicta]|uniref:uncharacterized protein LOC120357663 isoform X2 n=1 Tax=Solenopsis invicta TaxID=13686 RepID=UPI00193D1B8D|nr:uncharacterized protein LOC120357663 isoform X2 [Solenopsis invicta]